MNSFKSGFEGHSQRWQLDEGHCSGSPALCQAGVARGRTGRILRPAGGRQRVPYAGARTTRVSFWPPNPKLLERATRTEAGRALLGT